MTAFTTIRIHLDTRRQLSRMKGYMELKNGELFTMSDTIDALIVYYALSSNIPVTPT